MTSILDWRAAAGELGELFARYFEGEYPANSLVQVSGLAEAGLDVEIEAIAVLGGGRIHAL